MGSGEFKISKDAPDELKQKFVAYAECQGSRHAKHYYASITSMVNKSLFSTQGKFKNLRNAMNNKQLMTVAVVEQVVDNALIDGMALNNPYPKIYQDTKSKLVSFVELYGQSDVVDMHMLRHTSTTKQLAGGVV